MMRAVTCLALAAAPALALAEPSTWVIDAAHTQTSFEVYHLTIARYRGELERTEGSVTIDDDDPSASRVEATLDARSIRTRVPAWDARLRSPDFLDADRYPTIQFRSTSVANARGKYLVTGLLTLRGVTRKVVLDVQVTPAVRDPAGRLRRGIQAKGRLNRQDYGIGWAEAVQAGPLLSDDVGIEIDAEVVEARDAPRPASLRPRE